MTHDEDWRDVCCDKSDQGKISVALRTSFVEDEQSSHECSDFESTARLGDDVQYRYKRENNRKGDFKIYGEGSSECKFVLMYILLLNRIFCLSKDITGLCRYEIYL